MIIYRHKVNKQLYTISHLIRDIRYTNNNANAGIYATPYCHNEESIIFHNKNTDVCMEFVSSNFNEIAYT